MTINDNAQELLNLLENDMTLAQIALKLISVMMDKNSPQGPDKIGFDKNSLSGIIKRLAEKERSKGNRRYGRNSRGNNGGGGYRGGRGGSGGGSRGGSRDGGGNRGSRDGGGSRGKSSDSRGERNSRRRNISMQERLTLLHSI